MKSSATTIGSHFTRLYSETACDVKFIFDKIYLPDIWFCCGATGESRARIQPCRRPISSNRR
jgi:hypothetical protein